MFDQLCRNLAWVLQSDDPELVHQARVGWRRWRSAARLFRPWLPSLPPRNALRPLLDAMAQCRDLDVARTDVLPHWQAAYVDGDPLREASAHTTLEQLRQRSGGKSRPPHFPHRTLGIGAQILRDQNVRKMRLMSSPVPYKAVSGFDLEVTEFVPFKPVV